MTVVAKVHITIPLLHNRRGCSAFGLHLALVVYYAVCLTMPFLLTLYAGHLHQQHQGTYIQLCLVQETDGQFICSQRDARSAGSMHRMLDRDLV